MVHGTYAVDGMLLAVFSRRPPVRLGSPCHHGGDPRSKFRFDVRQPHIGVFHRIVHQPGDHDLLLATLLNQQFGHVKRVDKIGHIRSLAHLTTVSKGSQLYVDKKGRALKYIALAQIGDDMASLLIDAAVGGDWDF